MRTLHKTEAGFNFRHINFFYAEIFQSQAAADNINNRINCPYFMKMHFFKAFAVNFCFGEAKHAENIYRFIFYISA